jgi:CheY-like chemotaxis protein
LRNDADSEKIAAVLIVAESELPTTVTGVAVLVVDDDPRVRAMAVDMFTSLGLRVLDAYNGFDALRLLAARPEIMLLFTDVRMPGMTGADLAAEARRMRPDLAVVLTSGYLDATPLDGLPFLRKPYRMTDLAALVRPATSGTASPLERTSPHRRDPQSRSSPRMTPSAMPSAATCHRRRCCRRISSGSVSTSSRTARLTCGGKESSAANRSHPIGRSTREPGSRFQRLSQRR